MMIQTIIHLIGCHDNPGSWFFRIDSIGFEISSGRAVTNSSLSGAVAVSSSGMLITTTGDCFLLSACS